MGFYIYFTGKAIAFPILKGFLEGRHDNLILFMPDMKDIIVSAYHICAVRSIFLQIQFMLVMLFVYTWNHKLAALKNKFFNIPQGYHTLLYTVFPTSEIYFPLPDIPSPNGINFIKTVQVSCVDRCPSYPVTYKYLI